MSRTGRALWVCALLAGGACVFVWRQLDTGEGILETQRIRLAMLEREAQPVQEQRPTVRAEASLPAGQASEKPAGAAADSPQETAARNAEYQANLIRRGETFMRRRNEFIETIPAFRAAVLEQQEIGARQQMSGLAHWMTVSGGVFEDFVRLQAQHWVELGVMRHQLRDEDQNGQLWRAREGDLRARHEQATRALLGGANYQKWQEWSQSSNARGRIKVVNEQLPVTHIVRDENLAELAVAMHGAGQRAQEEWWASPESARLSASGIGMDREARSRIARERSLEQTRRTNAAMLAEAKPLLSSAQYEVLEAMLRAETAQREALL